MKRLPFSNFNFGLTAIGFFFFLLMGLILVSALTSGHNLLYLCVSLFFGIFICMGNAAVMNLRGLKPARKLPEFVHAGAPALIHLRLANSKRVLNSFSLDVAENPARNGFPSGHAFFPLVERKKEEERSLSLVFPQRGWQDFEGVEIRTRFPFGFWERSRYYSLPGRALVFPRIFQQWTDVSMILADEGDWIGKRIGTGDDLLNFRDFRDGDPVRWIHWKNSAKLDKLTVAVFRHPENRQVYIHLQTRYPKQEQPSGAAALFGLERGENTRNFLVHFEEAVSWAATAAVKLIEQGVSVGYMDESTRISPDFGEGHKIQILTYLALVKPSFAGDAESATRDYYHEPHIIHIAATSTGVKIGGSDTFLNGKSAHD